MAADFKILGGMSLPRYVTLISDKFRSSAWTLGGKIYYSVIRDENLSDNPKKEDGGDAEKKRQKIKRFSFTATGLLVALFLFIKLMNDFMVWLAIKKGLTLPFFMSYFSTNEKIYLLKLTVAMLLLSFTFTNIFIAGFHGAEHKVIECYNKLKSVDKSAIQATPPISDKCGGRLGVLMLILLFCFLGFAFVAEISLMSAMFFALLSNLWVVTISRIAGWDNAAWVLKLSRVMQKYITTREPNELELKVAMTALQKLVDAHEKLEAENAPLI